MFGLANSGTNGGQAGISPISPDAIEQIQVVIAPYDVTLGGFAGGGINAVTRSGTNELKGSVYYFFRNQDLAGKTPTNNANAVRTKLAPFTAKTYGARLGGAIIKNKLFFFTNVEIQRDELPRPFIQSEYLGDSDAAKLNSIRQKLRITKLRMRCKNIRGLFRHLVKRVCHQVRTIKQKFIKFNNNL